MDKRIALAEPPAKVETADPDQKQNTQKSSDQIVEWQLNEGVDSEDFQLDGCSCSCSY